MFSARVTGNLPGEICEIDGSARETSFLRGVVSKRDGHFIDYTNKKRGKAIINDSDFVL